MRKEKNEAFGAAVRKVLADHGNMTFRGADDKTGVNYNTISRMSLGHIPEMESVVKFALGFELDANDWLEMANYPRVDGGSPARKGAVTSSGSPNLAHLRLGQHESPKERLERRHAYAAGILGRAGFTVPPLPQYSHGGKFATNEEADNAYLSWLENVEIFNDGRKVPDELREE